MRWPKWLCVLLGGHKPVPPPPVEDWGPCRRCGQFARVDGRFDPGMRRMSRQEVTELRKWGAR